MENHFGMSHSFHQECLDAMQDATQKVFCPICRHVLPLSDFDEKSVEQVLLTNDMDAFRAFVNANSFSTYQMLRILGKAFELDFHEIAIEILMSSRELTSKQIFRFFQNHYDIRICIANEDSVNHSFAPIQLYYYACAHAEKVSGVHLLHLFGVRDNIIYEAVSYLVLIAPSRENMELMRELLSWNQYDHNSYTAAFRGAICASNFPMINMLLSYYPWFDDLLMQDCLGYYENRRTLFLLVQQFQRKNGLVPFVKSKHSLWRWNKLSIANHS